MAAHVHALPAWCRCNGQLVIRGEKVIGHGQGVRQKTGCLACGARAVRWLSLRERQVTTTVTARDEQNTPEGSDV